MEATREIYARQGDVLFFKRGQMDLSNKPIPQLENDTLVFATGTATGHRHRLEQFHKLGGQVAFDGEAVLVRLTEPNVVLHEEHAPIALDAGDYEVRIQKQYTPGRIENVLD